MKPDPDRTTVLAVQVVLGMTVWLTLANTVCQILQIPYKDPVLLLTLCTGVIGAVVYTTYDKRKQEQLSKPLEILLVEDSELHQLVVNNWIKTSNPANSVTIVDSPEKALQVLKRKKPDVIVLDLSFPGEGKMQGHEFAETLRKNPEFSGIEIIVLTGRDQPEYATDLMMLFSAWVEKGTGPKALLEAIADVRVKRLEKKD